ncbi:MAG: GNAT family N-acetyltransferase [Anaerolineae bacterium]|nr:GNAT family N-acetyltransferase [Anaerolineae bacterium]
MYTLRPATHADFEFLYQLHRATMKPYIEATWGWQESWQRDYFEAKWEPSKRNIIQIEGEDAGVLVIENREDAYYLGLIEILPEFQGQGVGTAVIQNFIAAAQAQSLPATLHVLKSNNPAQQLYERLGFVIVADEAYRYKMKWAGFTP